MKTVVRYMQTNQVGLLWLLVGILTAILTALLTIPETPGRIHSVEFPDADKIVIYPEPGRPLEMRKCDKDCKAFKRENRIVKSTTFEFVETEKQIGSVECCKTMISATGSAYEYCKCFKKRNSCSQVLAPGDWYPDNPPQC
ncbi:MAG: hypothetical protein FIA97_09495 [Methylococcaceae bacterium]|nr:hypothetical protein [Methylococcaceae bacterium]